MNRNLRAVSIGFCLVGGLIAIGSVLTAADFAILAHEMHALPPPTKEPPLDIGKYGIVALIDYGARAYGLAAQGLSVVAGWVATVVVVLALVTLLIGVILYFVGRGIGRHATWARVIGALTTVGVAYLSLLALTSLDRPAAFVAVLPIALSLYALWVLIWRFAE